MSQLTPAQIVGELDRYIVGQHRAKRAVAIALRNRMRRQKLTPELAEEVIPKNIIMIGPTGVGKTEIARRLAKLASSPFLKVEASKFTEVGYVGRDVESIIRDLTEIGVKLVRDEKTRVNRDAAIRNARERILDILLPDSRRPTARPAFVGATGHNPLKAFKGIFNGTGLNWFFPWVLGQQRSDAAFNLQQTLIQFTVLLLTGLAVAFAFRCGLFNIGGQGQYIVGTLVAVQIGTSFQSLPTVLHILFAIIAATFAAPATRPASPGRAPPRSRRA